MSDQALLSRRFVLCGPLALPLTFAACSSGAEIMRIEGATMGTTYRVVALDASKRLGQAEVMAAIDTALAEVNRQMSNWDPDSEISRFNTQESTAPVPISSGLAEVMAAAETVSAASQGRFDTTMGPVIELWGFGARGGSTLPTETDIAAARARAGHANTIRLSDGTLQKLQPEAQVYLAAIGKGYGADHVARALEGLGIDDYMVDIGGDLRVAGRNPDGLPWQIGIETPAVERIDVMQVVGVSNLGLASSGDYRNFFVHEGQRYSHLIDPRTGRPVTHNTASATVIAENAMLADAWATAMHIMGREDGLALAEELDLAVLFAERDHSATGSGFVTSASPAFAALST
ncbi:MAG: FAD:protein FMN transferase [Pseudomonadota bacterium]